MANVGKFVDGKLTNVTGDVGDQLRTWGSAISASMASGHHVGGLSVPNAWHGLAPEMSRARPGVACNQRRRPADDPRAAQQPVLPRVDGRAGRTRYEQHGLQGRRKGDASLAAGG